MLRLQGIDPEHVIIVVSRTQIGYQIGNAMSQNVVERLLVRCLPAANLVPCGYLCDRWEVAAACRRQQALRPAELPPAQAVDVGQVSLSALKGAIKRVVKKRPDILVGRMRKKLAKRLGTSEVALQQWDSVVMALAVEQAMC